MLPWGRESRVMGPGKSTLVATRLFWLRLLTVDLLNPDEHARFVRHPHHPKAEVLARNGRWTGS